MSVILKQLMGISARFHGYKPIYVASMEEAEEELNRSIKPGALRFQINRRQVEFSGHEKKGTGNLLDISTSGCAVHEATLSLAQDERIDIVIPLYTNQDELFPFTLSARVVSAQEDQFAVQFVELDEEQRERLYQCLAHEVKREMP